MNNITNNQLAVLKTTLKRAKKRSVLWLKIISLFSLVVLASTAGATISNTTDLETSYDNIFNATTLDIAMRSDQASFESDPSVMWPGDVVTRDIYVQKMGDLDAKYSQNFEMIVSSDIALCNELQLKVWYNWYPSLPATPTDRANLQSDLKYDGALFSFTDFDTNSPSHDPDMVLLNSNSYYANAYYTSNEHWFTYEVTLPSGADIALEDLSCDFNIHTDAWQTDFANNPEGFSDTELIANALSTDVWTPATPTNEGWNIPTESATPNETPLDLLCGDTTNGGDPAAPRISQNWSSVSGSNIIYQREVTFPSGSTSSGFYETNNYTNFSSFGSGPGTQGVWRTRVRAFEDNNTNGTYDAGDWASTWSNYCDVTLDTVAPITSIDSPNNGDSYALDSTVDIYLSLADSNPDNWSLTARDSSNNTIANFPDQIGGTDIFTNDLVYSWDTTGVAEDTYTITFEATDAAGNTSTPVAPSTIILITIDRTVGSTITVTNSPEKDLKDKVANGDFDKGLSLWNSTGQVAVVGGGQGGVTPKSGSTMAVLGDPLNVDNSQLSQTLDNTGRGIRSISFWYNLVSFETDPGFDEPALEVYLGKDLVYQVWAKDIEKLNPKSSGIPRISDWQYVSIYVVDNNSESLDITFSTQNTGDETQSSFAYIDLVSTKSTVVDSSAIFTIYSDNPNSASQVEFYYEVAGVPVSGRGESGLTFTLQGQPDKGQIKFWSVKNGGSKGDVNIIDVSVDNQPPSDVIDLKAFDEGNGEYSLTFTAPNDNFSKTVAKYDLKYSTEPIDDTNWDKLTSINAIPVNALNQSSWSPRISGEQEHILVKDLKPGVSYYFAVKSADSANKWSDISNIALVGIDQEIPVLSDVIINEVLYNPTGDDSASKPSGEWVELYNTTDSDIDLNGWSIKDKANNQMIITSDNSDNDLDTKTGETLIKAKGYLTVYRSGQPILNNDGDTIYLLDIDSTEIDTHTYAGGASEGSSNARKEDSQGEWATTTWITPGRKNVFSENELNPSISIWQQEQYKAWLSVFDANNYNKAAYKIEYDHNIDKDTIVTEVIMGDISITSQRQDQRDISFETCSSESCVFHENVISGSIKLDVVLSGDNIPERSLNTGLTGGWNE